MPGIDRSRQRWAWFMTLCAGVASLATTDEYHITPLTLEFERDVPAAGAQETIRVRIGGGEGYPQPIQVLVDPEVTVIGSFEYVDGYTHSGAEHPVEEGMFTPCEGCAPIQISYESDANGERVQGLGGFGYRCYPGNCRDFVVTLSQLGDEPLAVTVRIEATIETDEEDPEMIELWVE